jgi:hypothetical protein
LLGTSRRAGQTLRFELGPVEVEFLVQVQNQASVDGGIRFWVVSVGGSGSVASQSTHRIKLLLTPLTENEPGKPESTGKVIISETGE